MTDRKYFTIQTIANSAHVVIGSIIFAIGADTHEWYGLMIIIVGGVGLGTSLCLLIRAIINLTTYWKS